MTLGPLVLRLLNCYYYCTRWCWVNALSENRDVSTVRQLPTGIKHIEIVNIFTSLLAAVCDEYNTKLQMIIILYNLAISVYALKM